MEKIGDDNDRVIQWIHSGVCGVCVLSEVLQVWVWWWCCVEGQEGGRQVCVLEVPWNCCYCRQLLNAANRRLLDKSAVVNLANNHLQRGRSWYKYEHVYTPTTTWTEHEKKWGDHESVLRPGWNTNCHQKAVTHHRKALERGSFPPHCWSCSPAVCSAPEPPCRGTCSTATATWTTCRASALSTSCMLRSSRRWRRCSSTTCPGSKCSSWRRPWTCCANAAPHSCSLTSLPSTSRRTTSQLFLR